MDRAAIIYNPVSRNAPQRPRLQQAIDALGGAWQVELLPTEAPGHATELARRQAASGVQVVFACGGDGTVNEVVNGLASSDCALGLIRGGMGNVLAKEIEVPRNPTAALRLLVDGERRRFDLGVANGRCFLLMAGVGLDAIVVRSVPNGAKRRLGSTSYAVWGLRELVRYRPQLVQLTIDGMAYETNLYWLLLSNTRSYAGVKDIAATARADDGLLDGYVFSGDSPRWLAVTALRLALGRLKHARGVSYSRLSTLELTTPGLPVQADGEYFGETPMHFSVLPQALSVLLPRGRGDKLLSST